MLEQTFKNGKIYASRIVIDEKGKERLITNNTVIKNIKYLTGQKVRLYIKQNDPYTFYVEDKHGVYRYQNGKQIRKEMPSPGCYKFNFVYGKAKYQGHIHEYWMKDNNNAKRDPDLSNLTPPSIATGYYYNQKFYYPEKLIQKIGNLNADFVDRFKRPLSLSALNRGSYFPASIQRSHEKFGILAKANRHFPLVVDLNANLSDPPVAVMDLEPHFRKEDLDLAESFDYYYVEETPRGGRHYLVNVNDIDHYKWRLTDYLEVQVKTMVTLYGICGKWVNDDPKPADFSNYKEVGHHKAHAPEHVDNEKAKIIAEKLVKHIDPFFKDDILEHYETDQDESDADYQALRSVYSRVFMSHLNNYDFKMLPWILAYYVQAIIPYREKHDEERLGVPYLVYVAGRVLDRVGIIYTDK